MQLLTSMLSIFVNSFHIGLLRFLASNCEVTASRAAAVVSHLDVLTQFRSVWYCLESVSPSSKGKKNCDYLVISLGRRESKLVRKKSQVSPLFFSEIFLNTNVLNTLLYQTTTVKLPMSPRG